jgi:L-fuculose-phosphate aldolase
VRLGPGRFLVTPSGASKGHLRAADLVVVDLSGRRLKGRGHPSTELPMHLAAYAARPDVAAAVHAHPLTAIALTVAGLPPPDDLVPEASVTLGPIGLAPFAVPGTEELPRVLAPLFPRHDVMLLSRHGALALGATLAQAFDRMETLERVARVAFLARLLGRCQPMPLETVARVVAAAAPARTSQSG